MNEISINLCGVNMNSLPSHVQIQSTGLKSLGSVLFLFPSHHKACDNLYVALYIHVQFALSPLHYHSFAEKEFSLAGPKVWCKNIASCKAPLRTCAIIASDNL